MDRTENLAETRIDDETTTIEIRIVVLSTTGNDHNGTGTVQTQTTSAERKNAKKRTWRVRIAKRSNGRRIDSNAQRMKLRGR
jgi:hypothetical protein